jgi:hypothetical protein
MKERMMNMKCVRAGILSLAAGGLMAALAGCVVYPNGAVVFRPPVVAVAAPAPVVQVDAGPVYIPEDYAWDGYEYVGLVGDQYYYLGPGNVWLIAEPWRLERFHGWERGHADWRLHAIRNERFRNDRYGHYHARREDHH